MKVMSINCGSSSLKFSLFEMNNNSLIASGVFERIGLNDSFYTIKYNGEKIREEISLPDHKKAVEVLLDRLISIGIINDLKEIEGVGHRLAHGSTKYKESVLITDEVIEDLRSLTDLAPLHIPANILGIEAVKAVLPNIPMVGVFDTTFHTTMDPVSYIYPVPYEWYQKYNIRKFGFHGTSFRYICREIPRLIGKENYRAIICHLGSGGSICAVKDGKSVDTTMGFAPVCGIMMGTRSGDIDPLIIPYVMEKEDKELSDVINDLNKKSGFLGLSGVSSDFRDIYKGVVEGNERCKLAFDKYVRTVTNYIGSYYVELGGVDTIIFTAGLGENASSARLAIMEKLACLGVKIDLEKNQVCGEEVKISTDDSSICCYVVPTNEELMIALDTVSLM